VSLWSALSSCSAAGVTFSQALRVSEVSEALLSVCSPWSVSAKALCSTSSIGEVDELCIGQERQQEG
jgi:hypothetical protein